jgi:hypothetical protein
MKWIGTGKCCAKLGGGGRNGSVQGRQGEQGILAKESSSGAGRSQCRLVVVDAAAFAAIGGERYGVLFSSGQQRSETL